MEDWREIKGPDGKVQYYFNLKTGTTSNEKPLEYKHRESKAFDKVASLLQSIDETQ